MEHLLAAAALCIVIFTVFLLLQKQKRPQVYLLAIAFFCLTWLLVYYAASFSGLLRFLPILFHTDIVASAIAGPTVYLFIITVIMEGKKPVRSYRAYYIMPAVLLAVIIGHNLFVNPLAAWCPGLPVQFSSPMLIVLNFIPDAAFLVFFSIGLLRGYRCYRRGEIRHVREFYVMMVFLAGLWLVSAFMLLSYPLNDEKIFVVALMIDAFFVTSFFLAMARIPQYIFGTFPDEQPESSRPNQQATLLSPEEIELVRARLDNLLQGEPFFTDPDIKLQALAKRIGVSANQLSFFMNSVLGMGFREYINGLRLERVEKDLREKTDDAILKIAMDNGFASKTPFNALFQKKYGMTPSEYRKKLRAES